MWAGLLHSPNIINPAHSQTSSHRRRQTLEVSDNDGYIERSAQQVPGGDAAHERCAKSSDLDGGDKVGHFPHLE
jgi:hypothetical protein